jgi:hypothetical protein
LHLSGAFPDEKKVDIFTISVDNEGYGSTISILDIFLE